MFNVFIWNNESTSIFLVHNMNIKKIYRKIKTHDFNFQPFICDDEITLNHISVYIVREPRSTEKKTGLRCTGCIFFEFVHGVLAYLLRDTKLLKTYTYSYTYDLSAVLLYVYKKLIIFIFGLCSYFLLITVVFGSEQSSQLSQLSLNHWKNASS